MPEHAGAPRPSRVVFVHGACVKDGSWWWSRTAELLAEKGVAGAAPALPSCGETGEAPDAQGPGLAEDVAAVREVLTASDEPTVVVAHSYGGIVASEPAPFLDIDPEGGTFTVRQSLAILEQPVRAAAWQELASTYLVCTEDRGTPVDLQREFAGRADSVVELDAGHHPFLSRPDAVCDLVMSL